MANPTCKHGEELEYKRASSLLLGDSWAKLFCEFNATLRSFRVLSNPQRALLVLSGDFTARLVPPKANRRANRFDIISADRNVFSFAAYHQQSAEDWVERINNAMMRDNATTDSTTNQLAQREAPPEPESQHEALKVASEEAAPPCVDTLTTRQPPEVVDAVEVATNPAAAAAAPPPPLPVVVLTELPTPKAVAAAILKADAPMVHALLAASSSDSEQRQAKFLGEALTKLIRGATEASSSPSSVSSSLLVLGALRVATGLYITFNSATVPAAQIPALETASVILSSCPSAGSHNETFGGALHRAADACDEESALAWCELLLHHEKLHHEKEEKGPNGGGHGGGSTSSKSRLVHARTKYGSPLTCAAGRGHCAVAELLLSHGASVDGLDPSTRTAISSFGSPLSKAVATRQLTMARLLLGKYGANVNLCGDFNGPVYWTAALGDIHMLDLLIFSGADPELAPKLVFPAFFFCAASKYEWRTLLLRMCGGGASKENTAGVKTLLAAGADLTITDHLGSNALLLALGKENWQLAADLLRWEADKKTTAKRRSPTTADPADPGGAGGAAEGACAAASAAPKEAALLVSCPLISKKKKSSPWTVVARNYLEAAAAAAAAADAAASPPTSTKTEEGATAATDSATTTTSDLKAFLEVTALMVAASIPKDLLVAEKEEEEEEEEKEQHGKKKGAGGAGAGGGSGEEGTCNRSALAVLQEALHKIRLLERKEEEKEGQESSATISTSSASSSSSSSSSHLLLAVPGLEDLVKQAKVEVAVAEAEEAAKVAGAKVAAAAKVEAAKAAEVAKVERARKRAEKQKLLELQQRNRDIFFAIVIAVVGIILAQRFQFL